jgi:ectoine hydroxylase-related dioxygenase (phytanoyl-CoA dioxygenase family)
MHKDTLNAYTQTGYTIVKGLLSQQEVHELVTHYMEMNAAERSKEVYDPNTIADTQDPLKRYPRILNLHRIDARSKQHLLDTRLRDVMVALLGVEPYAVSTMIYFKAAGARGQALHQDQYYLRVNPGTCCAAWVALDDCDEENGCLQVVPGSHALPVLCTIPADTSKSFTDVTVPVPDDMHTESIIMKAGDVLFFNGQLIHGSLPNVSQTRFRRSLITHYIVGEAQQVSNFYHPALRFDGSEVNLEASPNGSECGVWVEQEGQRTVAMQPVNNAGGTVQ